MEGSLLDGVLAVTRDLHGSVALEKTLHVLAGAVVELLGFDAAAFNVVTDAGDMQVVAVVGPPSVQTLLGTRCSVQQWLDILDASDQWGELYFHGCESDQAVFEGVASWIPPDPATLEPGVWRPEDSLFAALRDVDRKLIGVLSVDQPRSGKRPRRATAHRVGGVRRTGHEGHRRRDGSRRDRADAVYGRVEVAAGVLSTIRPRPPWFRSTAR